MGHRPKHGDTKRLERGTAPSLVGRRGQWLLTTLRGHNDPTSKKLAIWKLAIWALSFRFREDGGINPLLNAAGI